MKLPAAAAAAVLLLACVLVRALFAAAWIRRRGDHLIVFGDGQLAQALVKRRRKHRGRLIAWSGDKSSALAKAARLAGGVVVSGAPHAASLPRLGVRSARMFVAAGDDQAANLEAAGAVVEVALNHRDHSDSLPIVARVDDVGSGPAIEARLAASQHCERVELRLVSTPQLVAREFLIDNPVERVRRPDGGPVRLCWIGWSPVAEAMAVRVLGSAHFLSAPPTELLVGDPDAAAAQAAFRTRYPCAHQIAPLKFEHIAASEPEAVARWAAAQFAAAPFNAVYVTLADPGQALDTARAIDAALARPGGRATALYVLHPNEAVAARALGAGSAVQPFGAVDGLADADWLLQEDLDEVARSIHELYLEGRLEEGEALGDHPAMAEWPQLPERVRNENRLIADCYQLKLRDVGCSVVRGRHSDIRFSASELEGLARAEHRRWLAARALHGAQLSAGGGRLAAQASAPEPGGLSDDAEEADREQIRMMPQILAQAGWRAVRDLVVDLRPPASGLLSLRLVRAALADLAERHPDRRIVVLVRAADAASCRLLVMAHDCGAACAVVLAAPAKVLLAELAPLLRDRVGRLLRRADRVYACPALEWNEERIAAFIAETSDRRVDLARGRWAQSSRPVTSPAPAS